MLRVTKLGLINQISNVFRRPISIAHNAIRQSFNVQDQDDFEKVNTNN